MKKISRRNFLLASGAVTIGAALAACGGSSSTSTASSAVSYTHPDVYKRQPLTR